jgi:hypothetical protein
MAARQRRAQRRHGPYGDWRFRDFFVRFGRSFPSRRGNGRRSSGLEFAGWALLDRPFFGFFGRLSDGKANPLRCPNRRFPAQAAPHQQSLVIFQRAGMRLFLGDAEFRKHFDNRVGLDFQLPGQLVDSNFTHTMRL